MLRNYLCLGHNQRLLCSGRWRCVVGTEIQMFRRNLPSCGATFRDKAIIIVDRRDDIKSHTDHNPSFHIFPNSLFTNHPTFNVTNLALLASSLIKR
jgi:hypothetical protein